MSGVVVGDAIAQRMNECGDEPITSEWTDYRGDLPARVAQAWGRKGLYVASDDSGTWIASGPFGGGAE